jgi:L-ascorbate metabolism protein UlaG (beta-lactamase superfamily)
MDGLPEADLPKADIILVTHHHQDHIKTATINRLATARTAILAPIKCAGLLGRKFTAVRPGNEFVKSGIRIKAVFAYNTPTGRSTRKVHHKGECVGYLITVSGKTIYHAGDSDFIPEMKQLGKVDIAFLPIGGTFTMDAREAAEAASAIQPGIVVPMHWMRAIPDDFAQRIKPLSKITARVMKTGDEIVLN